MKCPKCNTNVRMITKDSREWNGLTRRRKECVRCGEKTTTVEIFEDGLEEMEKRIRAEIVSSIKLSIDDLRTIKKVW